MKRLSLFVLFATIANAQLFPGTASRLKRAAGSPSAGECAASGDVGKVHVDQSAIPTVEYSCRQTSAGVYAWQPMDSGGAGSSAFSAITTGTNTTATTTWGSGSSLVATSATRTAPAKAVTSLPGTCTTGDLVIKTDATATQVLYACTATNTWTQQGGGSSTSYCTTTTDGTSITVALPCRGQVGSNYQTIPTTGSITFSGTSSTSKIYLYWTSSGLVAGHAGAATLTFGCGAGSCSVQTGISAFPANVAKVATIDYTSNVPATPIQVDTDPRSQYVEAAPGGGVTVAHMPSGAAQFSTSAGWQSWAFASGTSAGVNLVSPWFREFSTSLPVLQKIAPNYPPTVSFADEDTTADLVGHFDIPAEYSGAIAVKFTWLIGSMIGYGNISYAVKSLCYVDDAGGGNPTAASTSWGSTQTITRNMQGAQDIGGNTFTDTFTLTPGGAACAAGGHVKITFSRVTDAGNVAMQFRMFSIRF